MKPQQFLAALAVAAFSIQPPTQAEAHSWLACSDYRGDVSVYDDSSCKAYPRDFLKSNSGSAFGVDKGFDNTAGPCQAKGRSTNPKEIATYTQGQVVCLAWPSKFHVATKANLTTLDLSLQVGVAAQGVTDPTSYDAFTKLPDNFGNHVDGQADCLGFERAPAYATNTDTSVATGCFKVTQLPGQYTYQWMWESDELFTTCWDATVVAGQGSTGIPLKNFATVTDTLGAGGATCRTNWVSTKFTDPTTESSSPASAAPASGVAPAATATTSQSSIQNNVQFALSMTIIAVMLLAN